MAKTLRLNRRGDMLIAADNDSLDALRELPEGKALKGQIVAPRNEAFHRKVFSMVQLAHQMWEPTTYLSSVERHTVQMLADYLCQNGLNADAVSSLCIGFMQRLDDKRSERSDFDKSFQAFRNFITVEAGFYDVVITPAGPRKEPKSWSFAKMDEDTFQELYKAIFGVCWSLVLEQRFESPEAAEAAAEQLLNYT